MSSKRFSFILFYLVMSVSQILGAPYEMFLGGNLSLAYDLPYQVFLKANKSHICGGTLISPSAVLTAAHCIHHVKFKMQLTCKDVFVQPGSTDSFDDDVQRRAVKCHIHPDYVHSEYIFFPNDIAIIVLERKFKMSEQVKFILVTPPNSNYENQMALVSGWCKSTHPDGSVKESLFKLKTRILSQNDCQSRFNVQNSQICTLTSMEQVCSCEIDSGGSLVVNNTLIGVVSFRLQCGAGYPDIFTSVEKFRVFIYETLQIVENRREERFRRKYELMKKQITQKQNTEGQKVQESSLQNLNEDKETGLQRQPTNR